MASYEIKGSDKALIAEQPIMETSIQLDIFNDNGGYCDTINCGVISASFNIDASSDVRRTCSLELIPMSKVNTIISEDGLIWINRNIVVSIGVKNQFTGEIIYYKQGTYVIMTTSSNYDATTNTLSLSCSDWMARLDGSRNGNLGQLQIVFPAYTDYFNSLWLTEAKDDGVDINDYNAFFKWILNNGDGEYHNILTESNDETLKQCLWILMMNGATLSKNDIDIYMGYIQYYLDVIHPNPRIVVEFNEHRSIISDTAINIFSIRENHIIRNAMDTCIGQLGYIKERNIDDIGVAKAFPYYMDNWDWYGYRLQNSNWDKIPYDLEFAKGSTVLSIITTMRDLYENFECYFDINNTFCCNKIPSGHGDLITFDDSFIKSILISESTSIDFSEVKNVTECWGSVLEADFFAYENIVYDGVTYSFNLNGYKDEYFNGDMVAVKIPSNNLGVSYININNFGPIPIYDDNYEVPIAVPNTLETNQVYVFKIVRKRVNKEDIVKAYLQGQYQCHAMCVLTDGKIGEPYCTSSGKWVYKYSKEYFQEVYNVQDVYMDIVPSSPFTVQKLGVILNIYDDETNIQSCAVALESARQENYRKCRLTDNISLTTKMVPFADVNQKVTYQRSDADKPYEYLVQSLSHDPANGSTTWNLVRYYPTYIETEVK